MQKRQENKEPVKKEMEERKIQKQNIKGEGQDEENEKKMEQS